MLYAKRDNDGKIINLSDTPSAGADEEVSATDDEVIGFIFNNSSTTLSKKLLSETDTGMIRIVEDLIELLIQKNLIMFTDLPNAAQQKILMQNQIRSVFQPGDPLLVDDDELL
ncbi:MAG: hypothetical protein JAY75_09355 [Candidatus Thiodiazotropha taylori]|nr:hypothetical protein [Candidatus Thiodiazotropha taylori]MCW4226563.1 hypothetical protein [Candidatus Thiodiazotropha endolucinida]MCG7882802.1 hypothetical protein [Candidatus Thiodiazotropha taylori]MCG7888126.1 hypothetical protein [Candidatus Thiodiazotropha taylori]MCG7891610.1 hypothetical protein [Candidatus Thiodiazotropha taylori]